MAVQIQKSLRVPAWRFFCALGFLIAMQPRLAEAEEDHGCRVAKDVPVHITEVFEEPKIDRTADISAIQKILSDSRHSIRENISLGVTHYHPMLELRLPVEAISFQDGTHCAHILHAEVSIGYQEVVIYIAKEIPEGSCGFNEIMEHERKHIAVNKQILKDFVPVIEERLNEYLKLNNTFRQEKLGEAVGVVRQKTQAILDDVGEDMIRENQRRQGAVDSPSEYRRITASCDGQLLEVAERAEKKAH
ncbi:MAG: hypothetical protein M3N08_07605 [Pseudomonadota bacterium]|nr:hypothetical protein [Pseudomonadota bacterium]